jgi:UDP-3-O-[3-hydroxymyristoyl] glucosamine N-acyltransferase
LAERVGGKVVGDPNGLIRGVAGIREAKSGEITFVSNPRYEAALRSTEAAAVIVARPIGGLKPALLVVPDPYYAFCQIVAYFHQRPYRPRGISQQASIGKNVRLGSDLSIYPFVTIEDDAVIGDRVTLFPGVYIGEGSRVGEDSILYANVSIREEVTIGRRVIIHSGAVIGSDGFGFATHGGRHHKILQVGTVIIEDDVEIGANVTVDRAAMGKTVIGRGTKIDNLVQIAHNVSIGEDSLLVAQVGISGSTEIGHHVTLAGQVGVAGHLSIGDNVVVGGKSGVTKDIPSNQRVSGFPTLPHRKWLEAQASFPHLPEIRKRLAALEKKMATFERSVRKNVKRAKKS